jgi:short-chain fatty acids transporter
MVCEFIASRISMVIVMKGESRFLDLFQKYFPEPFVLAIILSLIAFFCSAIFGFQDSETTSILENFESAGQAWASGMWSFLAFGMQMSLILLFGFILASAPFVVKAIAVLANIPNQPRQAVWLTAFIACCCALLHWGLGLIVGALLAKEMGKKLEEKNVKVHYPLLAAAGYSSLLVWHGGLTGSAPLKVSNIENLPEFLNGVSIPLSETTFSPLNLLISVLSLLLIPILFARLHPKDGEIRTSSVYKGLEAEMQTPIIRDANHSMADKLENSRYIPIVFSLFLLFSTILWIIKQTYDSGSLLRIDWLNTINAIFFALALLAHPTIRHFLNHANSAVKGVAGIMIQFPLYAGTASVLIASGLSFNLSTWIVNLPGTQDLLPIYSFFAAGIVNLFVPSGGGQFIIQGPILFEAQQIVNASVSGFQSGTWLLALSYGDQWTNMLQPFWAIPLLAITGVKAREIMGYTTIVMLYVLPLYLVPLYFLA